MRRDFDRAASVYTNHAPVQRAIATDLADFVIRQRPNLTTLCDIGAGTGFVGQALPPHVHYTAVDTSVHMLRQSVRPAVSVVGDGENLPFKHGPHFDIITSSMTVQWFHDMRAVLSWRHFLKPNGMIVITTLGCGSFSPFYTALNHMGRSDRIPSWPTARQLQDDFHPHRVSMTQQTYTTSPMTLWDFLQSWRRIGAHRYPMASPPLTVSEMMMLRRDGTLYQHPYVIHRVVLSY